MKEDIVKLYIRYFSIHHIILEYLRGETRLILFMLGGIVSAGISTTIFFVYRIYNGNWNLVNIVCVLVFIISVAGCIKNSKHLKHKVDSNNIKTSKFINDYYKISRIDLRNKEQLSLLIEVIEEELNIIRSNKSTLTQALTVAILTSILTYLFRVDGGPQLATIVIMFVIYAIIIIGVNKNLLGEYSKKGSVEKLLILLKEIQLKNSI